MYRLNRKIIWTAVLLLLATLCTGCYNREPHDDTAANSTSSAVGRFKDHMDISIAFPDIDKNIRRDQEDDVLQRIETIFNITIKPVQTSYLDYKDKAKLWAASGQLPDIMFDDAIGTDIYAKWISQGIFRPLPTDMTPYPYLNKLVSRPDFQAYKRGGKLWSLPRLLATSYRLPGDRTLFVRKDWMAKLGLKPPQSYDELFGLLQAFAQKDPDGNGINDTVGITNGFLQDVFLNLDPTSQYWTKENGEWKPGFATSGFADIVRNLRKWYDAGVLDKDFALPNQDSRIQFALGKAGAIMYQSKNINQLESLWDQYNRDKKFSDAVEILLLPPGPDGSRFNPTYTSFWSESYFNGKMDDRKMDRILQLYDYLASPEGQMLAYYGFEGKDYRMSEGKVDILQPKAQDGRLLPLSTLYPSVETLKYLPSWIMTDPPQDDSHAGLSEESYKMKTDYESWMLKNAKTVPVRWDIEAYSSPAKDNLPDNSTLWSNVVKVILGKEDVDKMWANVLEEYNRLGLQQAIKDVNAKFN